VLRILVTVSVPVGGWHLQWHVNIPVPVGSGTAKRPGQPTLRHLALLIPYSAAIIIDFAHKQEKESHDNSTSD
jgi:hypothetical protein